MAVQGAVRSEWPALCKERNTAMVSMGHSLSALPCTPDHLINADLAAQVILLDQYPVEQLNAVIVTSTAAHGIFLSHAKTGDGFSGVENSGAGAIDHLPY